MLRRVFHYKTVSEPDATRVEFSGRISEHAAAKLAALLSDLRGVETVRLDLQGVSGLNSVGVREWLTFIETCAASATVELHRCSTAFVAQLNMVANFDGGARICSISLPFVCETCGATKELVAPVEEGSCPSYETPSCDVHRAPMLFDDLEDAYFAFLTRT